MTEKPKRKAPPQGAASPELTTLATVLASLKQPGHLSATRLRDLRSAVKRVAALLGNEPAAIPLDIAAISRLLAAVNPVAVGITSKRFANIRSDFLAAVKASGFRWVEGKSRVPLSRAWMEMMAVLSEQRARIGLSRLARFASTNGIEPSEINDATVESFMAAVRKGSLHRKPNDLHRTVTLI